MRVPDYHQVLPFYNRARFAGLLEGQDIDKKAILFPSWYRPDPARMEELKPHLPLSRYWSFIQVRPSSALVPVVRSPMDFTMLWMLVNFEEAGIPEPRISGKFQQVHYPDVVQRIDLRGRRNEDGEPIGIQTAHLYDGAGELSVEVVPEIETILALIGNETYDDFTTQVRELWTVSSSDAVKQVEASDLGLGKKKSRAVSFTAPDKTEAYLTDYLLNRANAQRIPLLIGNTAVAKSSIIKAVAERLGFRLMDVRCQFMDKLDIEGIIGRVEEPGGKLYSYNAPMREMLETTDDYMAYAASMVDKIDNYISTNPDIPKNELTALGKTKSEFENKAKPCVLFFDEITRAPKSVRQAFTTILNQKTFQGRSMSKCRIVGATNVPVGMPPDLTDIFLTEAVEDVATLDRFEVVQITPAGMFERWRKFASSPVSEKGSSKEGLPRFHEAVLGFIGENDERAYSFESALTALGYDPSVGNIPDAEEISVTPFPNYRTWEYVSEHLYAVQFGKVTFNSDLVEGFLGQNPILSKFLEYLATNYANLVGGGPKTTLSGSPKSDTLLAGVEECIDSGVPVLLLGMSSIGKTTRLFELAKKRKSSSKPVHVIPINLALKDRTDILGAPSMVAPQDELSASLKELGVGADGKPTHPLYKEFSKVSDFGLPEEVTVLAPDYSLQKEIKEAVARGEQVVLFFDEVNRASEAVMSALFEAISDNRFMGTTWNPGEVVVVAAGNYGPHHPDAGRFDPAFAARFSIFRKDNITPEDTENILKFMENKDGAYREGDPFDPVIVEFIRDMTPEDRVTMFSEIEERTISSSASSLRSFSDLNALLSQVKRPVFQGSYLPEETFSDFGTAVSLSAAKADKVGYVNYIQTTLSKIPPNWAGFASEYKVILEGGEERDMKDFHESLLLSLASVDKDAREGVLTNQEMGVVYSEISAYLEFYEQANISVAEERLLTFEAILGSDPRDAIGGISRAQQFLEVFNQKRGHQLLTIEDLVDEDLVGQYIRTFKGNYADEKSYVKWSQDTMEEYMRVHTSPKDPRLGGHLMLELMEGAAAPEWAVAIVVLAEASPEVMKCLEQIDTEDRILRGHALVGEVADKTEVEVWIKKGAA